MDNYKLWDVPTRQSFHVMAKNKKQAFEYLSYIAKLYHIEIYKRFIRYFDERKEYVLFDNFDDAIECPILDFYY